MSLLWPEPSTAFTFLRGKVAVLMRRPIQSWHNVPGHFEVHTSHSLSASVLSTLVSPVSGHNRHTLASGPLHLLILLPGTLPLNIHRVLTFFGSLLTSHLLRHFSWSVSPPHPCLIASSSGLPIPLILLYFSQVLSPDSILCDLSITLIVSSRIRISTAGGQEYFMFYSLPYPQCA